MADTPIHSGFIIHWTGKDIDDVYDKDLAAKRDYSETSQEATERYIERLKNILKYGLWMTKKDEDKSVIVNGKTISRPHVARTCFTDLKLSEARAHAAKYGRLGIGVKRPFLFARLGSPMSYFHPKRRNWFFDPYLSKDDEGEIKDYYSCFLKQMGEKLSSGSWDFRYFNESEWRIIYSDDIRKLLLEKSRGEVVKLFGNPRDKENNKYHEYYNTLDEDKGKPEYLIPLDAWFSMIIYPNLEVKNRAQKCEYIRSLINKIKDKETRPCPPAERDNAPIEVDLDACSNF
jgi:hypothetical protein